MEIIRAAQTLRCSPTTYLPTRILYLPTYLTFSYLHLTHTHVRSRDHVRLGQLPGGTISSGHDTQKLQIIPGPRFGPICCKHICLCSVHRKKHSMILMILRRWKIRFRKTRYSELRIIPGPLWSNFFQVHELFDFDNVFALFIRANILRLSFLLVRWILEIADYSRTSLVKFFPSTLNLPILLLSFSLFILRNILRR